MYEEDDFSLAALANETDDGDGTVTIHSATINGSITPTKTFYTYGIEHQDLGGGAESPFINQYKMINFIKAIINNETKFISASSLANTYNMYQTRQ